MCEMEEHKLITGNPCYNTYKMILEIAGNWSGEMVHGERCLIYKHAALSSDP